MLVRVLARVLSSVRVALYSVRLVRDHSHELTKKFRKLGLKTALSAKAKEGNLVIIDEAKLSAPKTKDLKVKLDAAG